MCYRAKHDIHYDLTHCPQRELVVIFNGHFYVFIIVMIQILIILYDTESS